MPGHSDDRIPGPCGPQTAFWEVTTIAQAVSRPFPERDFSGVSGNWSDYRVYQDLGHYFRLPAIEELIGSVTGRPGLLLLTAP